MADTTHLDLSAKLVGVEPPDTARKTEKRKAILEGQVRLNAELAYNNLHSLEWKRLLYFLLELFFCFVCSWLGVIVNAFIITPDLVFGWFGIMTCGVLIFSVYRFGAFLKDEMAKNESDFEDYRRRLQLSAHTTLESEAVQSLVALEIKRADNMRADQRKRTAIIIFVIICLLLQGVTFYSVYKHKSSTKMSMARDH